MDAHALPPQLRSAVARLLATGEYQATDRHGAFVGAVKTATRLRVLLTAEAVVPELESAGRALRTVKVPPLRVRRADVADVAGFLMRRVLRSHGRLPPAPGQLRGAFPQPPPLSRASRHLLESAELPGNERELELLVRSAMKHAAATFGDPSAPMALARASAPGLTLEADMFWSQRWSKRLSRSRANLFAWFP